MSRARDIANLQSSKITADAGIDIDNINIDGTEIDLSSGSLTLDVAGNIILDSANNGETHFYDSGSQYAQISASSGNMLIAPSGADKDILFKGTDNTSVITALTLDMSEAGAATFNSSATFSAIAVGQSSLSGGNIVADLHTSGSGVGTQLAFANDHNTDKFFVGIEGNTTGNAMFYQQKNADINFYTNNNLRMTLDNSGDLILDDGKFKSADDAYLTTSTSDGADDHFAAIDGGNGAGSTSRGAFVGAYGNEHGSSPGHVYIMAGVSGEVQFATGSNGDVRMRMDTNGNVGIGITPATKLDVGNGTERHQVSFASGEVYLMARNASAYITQEYIANQHVFTGYGDSSGNEAMRINSNGRLGIGTTSPYAILQTEQDVAGEATALALVNNNVDGASDSVCISFGLARDNGYLFGFKAIKWIKEQAWTTNASTVDARLTFSSVQNETLVERMSISNTGKITTKMDNIDYGLVVQNSHGSSPYGQFIQYSGTAPDNNTNTFLNCSDTSTSRLIIYSDGDIDNHDNSYGATSDERIKQDIVDANSQWDDIKAVKVRNFKKKDDVDQYGDKAWTQIGVIAQELETVSPKLIKEKSPTSSEIKHSAEFGTLYTKDDETLKLR
jgi:hypothetical protein